MAAAPDPDEVLRSTSGKDNFQRLARLLISGGTTLLREIFDQICPPSNLPTILNNAATKKQLKAAKLTKPQWDCLYPSPGVYGKSAEFDVTLLFRLLRTICNLIPPATGWDALPASIDHSLAADLARIKYYRNSVYGHVSQKMEITDDKFPHLWQEVRDALLRIAGQISLAKKTKWEEAIDNYLQDPLTVEDERNVEELVRWYKNDMEVKETVDKLKVTTHEGFKRLEAQQENTAQDIKDVKDMLHQLLNSPAESSQSTEGEREETTREENLETEDDEDAFSSQNVAVDELSRRIQQLKKEQCELQNQFMVWTRIRKCTKALVIEQSAKLSSSWSSRRVGTAAALAILGAISMPCIVAMLTYFSGRFGASFGFTVLAGGVGAAFGAAVVALGGGGSGDEVWTTIGAVLGPALGAVSVGAAVSAAVAGGEDKVMTGVYAVLGSALGAAVGSAVSVAGNVAAVGTIVGAVLGLVVCLEFGVNWGGVFSVLGAVVFAIISAFLGALVCVLVGVACFALLGLVVFMICSAACVSDHTSMFVSLVVVAVVFVSGKVVGVHVVVSFSAVGLEVGYALGATLLDGLVGAVAGTAFGAYAGAAVFTGVQKRVMKTLRMRMLRKAVEKDKKSFQDLQATINSLEKCVVEFAVLCRENTHYVLSSTLLEDEFLFLVNILRRTVPQSKEFRAEPNEEVLLTTLPNLIQEEANIHFTSVNTFLERFQLFTSNLEASEMSQELLECRSKGEIQTVIINFIEEKFTETFTSQL